MIELLFYLQNLLFTFFRKRTGNVAVYNIPAIFQAIEQRYKQQVGYEIEYPQWQQREQIPEEKNQIIYEFH